MALTAAAPGKSTHLIGQLGQICNDRGLPALAERLVDLQRWIAADLSDFERELAAIPRGADIIRKSAHHLLLLGGKHLRPMCVALAARLGQGFTAEARHLAVAVELVHSATLLHDDVIDLGDARRGAEAARCIYGNAASIFAGDWLLIEALRRIRRSQLPGLLDRMLSTIDEMIGAEAVQLENRGRINTAVADYFRVVEGKTASLFRWAMYAGARAGGLPEDAALLLEEYGGHLGVAFQAVDDLLDVDGDAVATGKTLFADLREGKMTYPLIVALSRDAGLLPVLERCAGGDEQAVQREVGRVVDSVKRTGAVAECRALAEARAADAVACLDRLPPGCDRGPGVEALRTVAHATVYRER
jgi:octaprenyl-diphosphate synthase